MKSMKERKKVQVKEKGERKEYKKSDNEIEGERPRCRSKRGTM